MRFFNTIKFRMNLWYLMLLAIAILFFSILAYLLLAQRVSLMNFDVAKISVLEAQNSPIVASGNPPDLSQPDSSYKLLCTYAISSEQVHNPIRSVQSI